MKLDKYTLTEKKFYVARKELDKLREEMYKLPYRKLEEPYQDGWKLILTLRDDIARSNKAPVIQDLIDKFGRNDICKNPKHISQIRKKPALEDVRRIVNKYNHTYSLGIKDIHEKEYNELPNSHKKYFSLVSNFTSKYIYGNRIMYECNIPLYYFVVKTHKRMITMVQDIDPVLKKKQAELEKLLEPYWRTTNNGLGYYHYYENRKERRKSKVDITKITVED